MAYPCGMTAERALYILNNKSYGLLRFSFLQRDAGGRIYDSVIHDDGITEEEDAAVKRLWMTMPGTTCYYDAVVRIAKGAEIPTISA